MYNHVLDQVPWFFYEFSIQPNVPRSVIATSPFGFHTLEEVGFHLHTKLGFPS
jgi:hypothetical protein